MSICHIKIFLLILLSCSIECGGWLMAQTTDVLTNILGRPNRLLVIEDELFFAEDSGDRISKISLLVPNPIKEVVIEGFDNPASMVLDGTNLYVTSQNKISVVDLTAEPPTMEDFLTDLSRPNGITIYNNELYFTESFDDIVSSYKLDGSQLEPSTFVEGLAFPSTIAIHNDIMYISNIQGDNVVKVDLLAEIPEVEEIIADIDAPIGCSVYQNELYVAAYQGGQIVKLDILDEEAEPVNLLDDLVNPTDIAIYGNELYIADNGDSKIVKISLEPSDVLETNETNLNIYPNPTSSYFQLDMVRNRAAYHLFDTKGKIVKSGTANQGEKIDVSQIPTGMYLLKLDDNTNAKLLKLH